MARKNVTLKRVSKIAWTEKLTNATLRHAFIETMRIMLPKIAEEAQRRVPVRTGKLKSTIKWDIDEANLTGYVMAGGKQAFYAHFPEFGTISMAAEPYLRPALDKYRRDIVATYRDQLRRTLSG